VDEAQFLTEAQVDDLLRIALLDDVPVLAYGIRTDFQTVAFYSTTANTLDRLAGAYTGTAGFALGVRPAVFTVTASGAVTSSINGCAITGTASPRADSDTYDLTITFGGPPCAIQNVSFTGVAYQRPDNGRLYVVARNATLRQSVIFSGVR